MKLHNQTVQVYLMSNPLWNDFLYWQGAGYYASKFEGSHENECTVTKFCGDEWGDRLDGFGTPEYLKLPYGEKHEAQ